MPSGVTQAALEGSGFGVAAAKSTLAKFGMRAMMLIYRLDLSVASPVNLRRSCWTTLASAGNEIMGPPQRRQRVATDEDKVANACLPEFPVQRGGAAGEPDRSAFTAQRLRRWDRPTRIDLVRRAQTCELGARGFECRDHRVARDKALVARRLDPAGREKALGEGRLRREIGRCAQVCDKNFRPSARVREHSIG